MNNNQPHRIPRSTYTLSERIEQLRNLNIQLRRQLELAETLIPIINDQLKQLNSLQFGCKRAFLGAVIYQRPYDRGYGPEDSCQIVQAAAVSGHGVGVMLWDSEEYEEFCLQPWPDDHNVLSHFIAFSDLDLATRALLVPQVESLLDTLCQQIFPPHAF